MNLGGIILSASHVGRERRRAPTEDGQRWVEENGDRRGGVGVASLLSLIPKGSLVTTVLLMAGYMGWLSKTWVDHVNEGMVRLGAVETLAAVTAAGQAEVRAEIVSWRAEQRRQWADQIDQYKWMAEIEGDHARVRALRQKLEALKADRQ